MAIPKKYKLDKEETEILEALESGKLKPLPDSKKELQKLKMAATAYLHKARRVNIRLAGWDYEKAQAEALKEGVPTTTLMTSILHKFFSGQLVERNAA